ncbi:MAG: DUF6179 domain-containing protein [Clostridiales bacterium]|nr:DUF6179 domain-containing protein [Clostridiales bacterium]
MTDLCLKDSFSDSSGTFSGADGRLKDLLRWGAENGIITDADLSHLGAAMYGLTADLCRRRTGGRSGSLPTEAVQVMYESLAYTIGLDIANISSPREALNALMSGGPDASRRRGRRIIERKLQRSCFYLGRSMKYRLATDNETYVLTLEGALRGFFRIYDPVFSAHERKIGCDYPLVLPPEGLLGIEYIEEYTRRLYFESLFCSALDPYFLFRAGEFYAPNSRRAIYPIMLAALEALLLIGTAGIKAEELSKPGARAALLSRFYAAVYSDGNYPQKAEEIVRAASEHALQAADENEFLIFPADRPAFCGYCLRAMQKAAPALLCIAGAAV